ncbi:MAG: DUF1501 domain-containing protein [Bacteroidota bacterium]
MKTSATNKRKGTSLADGAAHKADHATWTRRSFLEMASMGGIATTLMAGGLPMQVFGKHALFQSPQMMDNDRTVVLIRLNGGNDGLNTVIPFNDGLYYEKRPNIAIAKADALSISDNLGLHPSMTGLKALWDQDQMSVLTNVGYPSPNKSHATSGQIWERGDRELVSGGWGGRYIEASIPDIYTDIPEHPVLTQVGSSNALFFNGRTGRLGFGIPNDQVLERLAESSILYDAEDVPATLWGEKLSTVRRVANSASQYGKVVGDTLQAQSNAVEYPDTALGRQLASIAKMIRGGLTTKMYLVRVGGWDTHENQLNRHVNLLTNLSNSLKAFQDDLDSDGHSERVLTATISEFGRRVHENGSFGTDHGEAAPLFVLGKNVLPGVIGDLPDLSGSNLPYSLDFRSVYATIMEHWLGLDNVSAQSVVNGAFDYQPFVAFNPVSPPDSTGNEAVEQPAATATLAQNYPNPFNPATNISFELAESSFVSLRVFDLQGRLVDTLVSKTLPAGPHNVTFEARHLTSGTYLYRLESPQGVQTKRMVLLR